MNAYEYMMAKGAGLVDTSEEEQSGGAEVEFNIIYDLTYPDGTTERYEPPPDRNLGGMGVKHIKVFFGF